ncbi:hypothetical protein [Streptomyces spectabilis]|uniref:Uncharacterized protein n=1 Tax=Streptomyces spectabilis TaxID=68270 RepID=A0A5P2X4H4_STRST|nr:hypothetical protein [Streptomyces spectabilis]MBB5108356.1 hypothetical protein [Streptomyces spectabilis]MCI3901113.1 hypothetical protein [Streptomyces spectabilis]QEV58604.1 hypothetical protein CP982_07635 [Streptomyces spectabilis]GGV46039.1 hypothetical protein GCM10010245_72180 [Streptomyces spectabilis]
MTEPPEQPRRLVVDRGGRVTAVPARPGRPNARRYLTPAAEQIIAHCYPGQVIAVVIERALRHMAIADGLLKPKPKNPRSQP